MDGFIILLFLIFFVIPFIKRMTKNTKKSVSKYRDLSKNVKTWGMDHGQVKQQRHRQLQKNNDSHVFPEDHDDRVRARDLRDRKELRRMETNIHGKHNKAMTKVSNKSRTDWGTKGEGRMTSSKSVMIFLLLLLLAHFVIVAFAPNLVPGS
ncbi:MAG: hypothetical protein EX271_07585 [Acidimicrobiales bacterium]|nr:hypothetical protein [Hyphomonadaceae bacterium]RZV41638.1 MAG: hypothetical protein EX271_07585 [Acidimicrobiales bacterium]